MPFSKVTAGKNLQNDINVIVEIPSNSDPIKYEMDKHSGLLCVDRFMTTSMHYPCNYGYVPQTLSEDSDPVDVLVVCPYPLLNGSIVRCRPIGMLEMTDEAGRDTKILAVPIDKLTPLYKDVKEPTDLSPLVLSQISHFFEHYKDLEEGKWVKIEGWSGPKPAIKEIEDSAKRYQENLN